MKYYPTRPALFRMRRIDHEIRSGHLPTAPRIAKALEVSTRTIQRDIEYMRDCLDAPIEYDAKAHGYRYSKTSYEFQPARLTEGELVSVLIGSKALAQYAGTPFEADLKRAFNRIAEMLPEEVSVHMGELADATSFAVTGPRPMEIERFRKLTAAIGERKRLRILYTSLSGGKTVRRLIDPYKLVCVDGAWYVIAFCHLRKEVRMFVPERMGEYEETGETFTVPAGFKLDDYMHGAFRVMRGGKPRRVRLLFSGWAARYVCERRWNPTQRVKWRGDKCVLEMTLTNLDEVAAWAMSFAGDCCVLTPAELKKKVEQGHRAGLRRNGVR